MATKCNILTVLCTPLISAGVWANTHITPDVIYGTDNRQEVFESTDAKMVDFSRSTAAMIQNSSLKVQGSIVEIKAPSLKEKHSLCASEKFSHQPAAAQCSGFLISDRLLVTAGHCYVDKICTSYQWVFDFKAKDAGQKNFQVPATSVYRCKKVLQEAHTLQLDYAVIELDRPVRDRAPLSFRKSGRITKGEPLVVIGHPSGVPTKIADGAKVIKEEETSFVADLDTYTNNSGSPVLNEKTGLVEGILVRGEEDHVFDQKLGCHVSKVCQGSECSGETVIRINSIPYFRK